MILVDSSVLIDLIERTPEWFGITYLHIPAAAAHAASAAHRVPTVRRAGRGLRHCRIFSLARMPKSQVTP
ncbi:hypothetical protein [Rhodoferax antarcticus]|uniref:PIN domain-containing protein n=1 Tax=Rhodoferax antarcticus ANT.BR TaxID=1111071 RepID=A0A1Q8YBN9_9BURK|nr:hypothetical protein [Rhodoferax antarcticus]APW46623.1 hypothetical protein RA876_09875 [Rhodoferax antarcticus]OLP05501.1 hypothetical protein BLL52_3168 [Rhodoferax antarcticus ANT.BR]